MGVRALTARATTAERRTVILQNQLVAAEEKIAAIGEKTTAADNKWETRVKEYEARLKQAEEKIKRERQGGKERVLELETQARCVFFHLIENGSSWSQMLMGLALAGATSGRLT